ncbi:hypothetical protein [Halomarina litorea]|uniref:hypothetical protein n=1 Tax=Halomarina litorea TaxID=2961595 RepID=UPI0020C3DE99|nr:hypothetical protein [Halomarina sp. BCD28]
MNRVRAVGLLVTGLALVGYVVGAEAAYPGRALTLTGLMVGVALVAMSGGWG